MRWGKLAVAVVLAATLGACGEDRGTVGLQCERNSQCQAPLVCRLTRCRNECATARDCPAGSLCVVDGQGIGSCRLPDEDTCVLTSECPEGLVCENGQCTNECAADRDCPVGAVCEGTGCVDLAETICVFDSDCRRGSGGLDLVCASDQRCRAECISDRDCRPGEECADTGLCEPIEEADAGVDGGPDGGLDAGASDGGLDGGADAGSGDAGPVGPACGTVVDCPSANGATLDCVAGRCVISSCSFGMTDCDGVYANGCESYLPTDRNNCTTCGNACGVGELCVGSCQPATVTDVEAGRQTTCALISTGHVMCWGHCNQGSCGDGTGVTIRVAPALVQGLSTAVEIAVGNSESLEAHACARLTDGTVSCWGSNASGQTSATPGSGELSPVAVSGLSNVVEIAAGADFTCARRMDGTVWCWGEQSAGRLGVGPAPGGPMPMPSQVVGVTAARSLMTTAYWYMCAEDGVAGNYKCWGADGYAMAQVPPVSTATPTDALGINSAGLTGLVGSGFLPMSPFYPAVSFGLDATGGVFCWGTGHDGLCGADGSERNMPFAVPTLGSGYAQVAAGQRSAVARTAGGDIRCWGRNDTGICGLGRLDSPITTPEGPAGINDVVDVAIGDVHACIVRSSGGVWCAGNGIAGQLGIGVPASPQSTFQRVTGL